MEPRGDTGTPCDLEADGLESLWRETATLAHLDPVDPSAPARTAQAHDGASRRHPGFLGGSWVGAVSGFGGSKKGCPHVPQTRSPIARKVPQFGQ